MIPGGEVVIRFDDAWDTTVDFLAGVNKAMKAKG